MPEFGWGIIGAGGIARQFATDLANVPDSRLVAVGSRHRDRVAAYATEIGAERGYRSYEELVSDPDVDLVYVANDHVDHVAAARLAIEAGKPVLVEKPFAVTRDEAASVFDLARQRRGFVMEAMWTRFLPATERLIEAVAAGVIGPVRSATIQLGNRVDDGARFHDPARAGGALLDMGVYPVAIAHMVLGPLTVVEATGHIEGGVDLATDIVATAGDTTVTLRCAMDRSLANTGVFEGETGRILVSAKVHHPAGFTIERDGGIERVDAPLRGHGFEYEIAEVHRAVTAGEVESSRWPHADTLAVAGVLDDARRRIGLVYPFEL